MPVRDFAAGGVIRLGVGTADPNPAPFTMVALVNMVVGTEWLMSRQNITHVNANLWDSLGRELEVLHLYSGGAGGTVKPPNGVWCLLAGSKPAGATKATYSYYRYDTKEQFSGESPLAYTSAHGEAPGEWQLGRWNATEQFNGKYAAAMVHGAALSLAELKALAEAPSIKHWLSIGPMALWMLNQKEVTEEVKDLTGNGANQISREGTAVAAEEPPIPFERPGIIAPRRAHHGLILSGRRSL